MYLRDWILKLDDFLRVSDLEILNHAGRISHEQAIERAAEEFEKYRVFQASQPAAVDRHFETAIGEMKQIEAGKAGKSPAKPRRKKEAD